MNELRARILLVDDNPDDRALVRREAEALFPHAELREAGSREDFENAVANGAVYDLVVTDLYLKWGNGREVVSTVREIIPGAALVMFTGTGDEMTAVELMKAGLDDYVVKHTRQLPRLRASMKLAMENARQRSALSERERQLVAALSHKDMMARELHHRVKNNLQTIITLLELRAQTASSPVRDELQDLSGRMRALGKVQARIYDSDALDRVNFAEVLAEMATELVRIYGDGKRISLTLNVPQLLELDVRQAMPMALLCYEILQNAMKHAWPDLRPGKVAVQFTEHGGTRHLSISDDGVGFVEETVAKGFGSRLTPALAREADARLSISSGPKGGTKADISF